MPRTDDRIAYVEGQVSEISQGLTDIRAAIRHLEQRFDALDGRMSQQFMWLVGIQATTLAAIIIALMSRG